ncbi:MAG: 23S rRNA pseudouridine1911/1915/1917 synthase [Chlamydiales bacterium]|jgi:23S rRNA pseudouridine1911/1915/1917 synthase
MSYSESEIFIASEEDSQERLDIILTKRFNEKSRTYFQYLIESHKVLVNDNAVKKRHYLQAGDSVEIHFILPPDINLEAEDISLNVIYEDEYLLAINKSPGTVVHPAPGHWTGTVVNGLLYHCDNLENPKNTLRPGIVHRLDKDTSGILLAAKTYEAQKHLIQLFSERKIEKKYLAICIGNPGETRIEAPIGRHPVNRKKMAILESGKPASSIFNTHAYNSALSFVEVTLETGRTHQIRVHSQHNKTPILGDNVYGSIQSNKKYAVTRQMLHAHRLIFIHPFTQEKLDLKASIPDDMHSIITKYFPKVDTQEY